jgi:hypothetical protein
MGRNQPNAGGNQPATRPRRSNLHALTFHCRGENIGETFTTIGQRAGIQLPVAVAPTQCAEGDVARLRRAQGALEFVKNQKDAHPMKVRVLLRAEKI